MMHTCRHDIPSLWQKNNVQVAHSTLLFSILFSFHGLIICNFMGWINNGFLVVLFFCLGNNVIFMNINIVFFNYLCNCVNQRDAMGNINKCNLDGNWREVIMIEIW